MNQQIYDGPADFRVTLLTNKARTAHAVELHVPGFMTWTLSPERALAIAQELRWAAMDAIEKAEGD